jgi:hypothetical protein
MRPDSWGTSRRELVFNELTVSWTCPGYHPLSRLERPRAERRTGKGPSPANRLASARRFLRLPESGGQDHS